MLYLATLLAVVTFHMFYTEFDSALLLGALLALPALSLAVSLPAMLRVRLKLSAPARVRRGERAELTVRVVSPGRLPVGGLRLRLYSHNRLTGEEPYPPRVYVPAGGSQTFRVPIDTAHCGCIALAAARVRVMDHLGLFALPVRRCAPAYTTVLPVPAPPDPVPKLFGFAAHDLRPKPGGGFSEEHELRPYREGDPIVSVHWKLSSKLDSLVVREAMEPRMRPVLLTFDVAGAPDALDSTLDQLAWLSGRLSAHHLQHVLQWHDGAGRLHAERVADAHALEPLLRRLLSHPAAERALPQAAPRTAGGYYHVRPAAPAARQAAQEAGKRPQAAGKAAQGAGKRPQAAGKKPQGAKKVAQAAGKAEKAPQPAQRAERAAGRAQEEPQAARQAEVRR